MELVKALEKVNRERSAMNTMTNINNNSNASGAQGSSAEIEVYKKMISQRDQIIKQLNERIISVPSPKSSKQMPLSLKYDEMNQDELKNKYVDAIN